MFDITNRSMQQIVKNLDTPTFNVDIHCHVEKGERERLKGYLC
jgi:hypothetical protein